MGVEIEGRRLGGHSAYGGPPQSNHPVFVAWAGLTLLSSSRCVCTWSSTLRRTLSQTCAFNSDINTLSQVLKQIDLFHLPPSNSG